MSITAAEEQTAATLEEPTAPEPIEQELLVEDVSIDGMCGVY